MRVRVLGSAAGGGFPQWNCACDNCVLVRRGDSRVQARTQDSLAIEVESRWLVVNASPDIHRQIEATPDLHPRARRDTPIAAIVLLNGDLDHVLGLFSLRESQPLIIYATERVWSGLAVGNVMMRTLQRFEGQVTHRRLVVGQPVRVPELAEVTLTAFVSPGKLPVHLASEIDSSPEDNIGLRVEHAGKSVVCATSVRDADAVASHLASDALFFDGTFWSSDELADQKLGSARAEDMAHHPLGGAVGSLERLASVPKLGRKILTHINNSNPILRDDSRECAQVREMGWEIAYDGMEVSV